MSSSRYKRLVQDVRTEIIRHKRRWANKTFFHPEDEIEITNGGME